MFKYTPKKQILRELQVSKTGDWWNKEYCKRQEVLTNFGVTGQHEKYVMGVVLKSHYPTMVFYSETPVREVPVNGFLFPVAMFDEEKTS